MSAIEVRQVPAIEERRVSTIEERQVSAILGIDCVWSLSGLGSESHWFFQTLTVTIVVRVYKDGTFKGSGLFVVQDMFRFHSALHVNQIKQFRGFSECTNRARSQFCDHFQKQCS